jgi:hypothetical protein
VTTRPRAAGERNDIDEAVIAGTFGGWRVLGMERAEVPSDTRMPEVIVARLPVGRPLRHQIMVKMNPLALLISCASC